MGSGSRYRFTMGSGSRCRSEPCSLQRVILRGIKSYWVLKLYSQLWGQVYYEVRVQVQVYYRVQVKVRVRAVLFAAGDPEETIGFLGSEAVFSAIGSGFPMGSGSRYRFTMGSGSRYRSEPCTLQRVILRGL